MRFALAILLFPMIADAATWYVRDGGSGAGSTFTDAFDQLTSAETAAARGDTIVYTDGAYSAVTLNTAASGSTTITLRKASAADSGVAGYNANLHDGQAVLSGLTVSTDYWIIDGGTRDETDWQDETAYGLILTTGTALGISPEVDQCQFKYIALVGSGIDAAIALNDQSGTLWRDTLLFHRMLFENWAFAFHSREADNVTIEYCHLGPTYSKECISHQYGANWIIRWNKFIDNGQGTGGDTQTATIGMFNYGGGGTDPADTQADGVEIYGNVFGCSDAGFQAGMSAQDALLSLVVDDAKIYHNTISRTGGAWAGRIYLGDGTADVQNNLWYWMGDTDPGVSGSKIAVPSNTDESWCYYKNSTPAHAGLDCSAIPNTVYSGTEDPFEAEASGDYRIKDSSFSGTSPIDKANNLSAPYNVDAYGTTHDNIGAYGTFGGGSPPVDGSVQASVGNGRNRSGLAR